jgi:hypothetical protein
MPENVLPLPRNNPVVFTLLITIALASAVLTGAWLSGVASGAVQDLLAGFGPASEIIAEQHRQALALEKIELSVSRARADTALLEARVDDVENAVANPASDSGRHFDLASLRSSLDEQTERTRNEFRAVNKRVDWLEKLVYSPDSSVQPAAPARRQGTQSARGWYVLHAEKGVAVISGKGGAIDVTPGFTVPDLGRIAAIRQDVGGRWVVVTDKGTTIRER